MLRGTDALLSARSSQLRDWALFVLAALLPALAVGGLGFRALQGEEDAIRRQAAAALDADAQRVTLKFDEDLRVATTRLQALPVRTRDALTEASMSAMVPSFAQPVVLDEQRRIAIPRPRTQPAQPPAITDEANARCLGLADELGRGSAAHLEARSGFLQDCEHARSWSGRWLWPIVALHNPDTVQGEAAARWLESHATWMTPAERELSREELRRATRLQEPHRARAARALEAGSRSGDRLPNVLGRSTAASAFGRGPAADGLVSWRGDGSAGVFRLLEDGSLVGFVVDRESLDTSLGSGWAGVSPSHRAFTSTGPASSNEALRAVARLVPDLAVVVTLADPHQLADRAARSRLILGGIAVASTVLALLVAALLFARVRAARRLGDLRTGFVSTVSHELRTPVASLRMLAELLEQGRVEEQERAEVVEALAREARRLGDTVDRLLGFGRMAAGRYVIDPRDASVRDAVLESVAQWEETHSTEPPVVRRVSGEARASVDTGQLRLAVDNLLANARKYAPEGAPYEVVVADDGNAVRIEVADRGPGIAPRDHQRIFRAFERGDDRLSKATEGSGIGLAIVAQVAKAHGGTVRLESSPGQGARFILRIPRA